MGTFVEVPHDRVFQFEGFSLDVTRRVLRNGDREVDLRPKSFDVLCCLVQHGGQLVTKDELLRSVWPGVTVSDKSLARCVSDIRLSLDDRDQRIVKTVPGRGYLLAASVLQLSTDGRLAKKKSAAGRIAGAAVDRRAAVHQHERRSGPGVLQRRDHRGHHGRPGPAQGLLRDRPQHDVHLQGKSDRRARDRA